MSGNATGVLKTAAKRVGLTVHEYQAHIAAGEKWCYRCKAWHSVSAFPLDRSRGDSRKSSCLESWRGRRSPQKRDPTRERARAAVKHAVRTGRIPHPNAVPCTDCGHRWSPGERRHENDHHRGYSPEHRLSVEPVCTTCHADREKKRRAT